jgi:hypothetical protein
MLLTKYRTHLLASLCAFLLLATFAFAQTESKGGLVPCGNTGKAQCNWCDLIQLIQNLINYAIYLGVLIGAIVFAYAGVEYMTMKSDIGFMRSGGAGGVEYAKSLLKGVVTGLVCIMVGWLVIDTLLKALVDDAKFGVWNKIDCEIKTTTEGGYSLPTNARPTTGGGYSDIPRR